MLTCAYLSYLISENIEFSGIITLFSCGFTMAHYAYFNMSRVAQKGSKIAVQLVADMSESFLYVYLGLSAFSINWNFVMPKLILIVLIATIIGRILSVVICMYGV